MLKENNTQTEINAPYKDKYYQELEKSSALKDKIIELQERIEVLRDELEKNVSGDIAVGA